ncbi:MAG TPA: sulfatase-like hydrolase/transferase [Bacteroidales bacterium]|nr:sulfatase-like hydrolase/transferase [Bacteroidales bacterium]
MTFKLNSILRINKPVIFYPWLLVMLFILTKIQYYGINPGWSQILVFLTLNLVLLILVFVILNYIFKDRFKVWLIDFFLFVLLLFFSKIKTPISDAAFFNSIFNGFPARGGHLLFVIFFFVLFVISVLIIRYKGSLKRVSLFLNMLLTLLIIYQIFADGKQNTRKIRLVSESEIVTERNELKNISLPDIYYIILDAYTSNASLKEFWGYDNKDFEDYLRGKGFLITTNSRTNYNMTPYSLASSLNMSYLTKIPHYFPSAAQTQNLFDLVDSSRVVKTLLKNNYEFVNYSFFNIQNKPKFYNDYFFFLKSNLLDGTIYESFAKKLIKNWTRNQNAGLFTLESTDATILNKLPEKINSMKSPHFVYAHIMLPHEPYFFDESGTPQEPDSALNYLSKSRYLKQLKYLNKLVIKTVSRIFENNSEKLPVIIIQGDHGWRYLYGKNRLKESGTILNAYFFPDQDYGKIYPSISPVNTFRVILNKYLDSNLKLLKDTTYNVYVY